MNFIDPSYLRSIRDGILNGTIEVNNSNALPEGLAGVFDQELFPSTLALRERRELLLFFLPFALAQKEISVDFAADVLAKTWMKYPAEVDANHQAVYDQVNRFIQHHSKRFVSAGEGKYRLYHERFRVYILQKVTELDIRTLNDQIISLCEKALGEKSGNEKEIYALEFLSTHLYINAMQDKEQGAKLKSLAYDQTYWERQIKASKSFEWSKRMLNEMMAWASKFDEEEVIECALQKVDLYHQEQNDAPRIVQLVADGEIETALTRIDSFGGDDKEGLKRKFTLYMLCLMELTLLESNNKPFRKEAIEKLLAHLHENLPVDHSLLNWDDFFPSYLVFLIASKLQSFNIEWKIIFSRTFTLELNWIQKRFPYTGEEIELLINLLETKKSPIENSTVLTDFFKVMHFQGKTDEAIVLAYQKLEGSELAKVLMVLSTELWHSNIYDKANELINDVKNIAEKMSKDDIFFGKNEILAVIAINLAKQRKFDEALEVTGTDIKRCMTGITLRSIKINTLLIIAEELVKAGEIDQAIELTELVGENKPIIGHLAEYYARNGQIKTALGLTDFIEDEDKEPLFKIIVDSIENKKIEDGSELVIKGNYREAFNLFDRLTHEKNIFLGFKQLAEIFYKIGNSEQSVFAIEKARDCLRWGIFSSEQKIILTLKLIEFLKNTKIGKWDYELSFILSSFERLIIENDYFGLKLSMEYIDSLSNDFYLELTEKVLISFMKLREKVQLKIDVLCWLIKEYPNERTIFLLLNIGNRLLKNQKKTYKYLTPYFRIQYSDDSTSIRYYKEKLFSLMISLDVNNKNLASLLKKELNKMGFTSSGILENNDIGSFEKKEILVKIKQFKNNEELLWEILYKYYVGILFKRKLSKEEIDRYNRTLNIQWAIDIKNQLPS
jgi:hypothetical protein